MLFCRTPTALYERLLKEKDRQIEILADQVDYLRLLLAERGRAPRTTLVRNPSEQPDVVEGAAPYLSEEEELLEELRETGKVSDSEIELLRAELDLPHLTRD